MNRRFVIIAFTLLSIAGIACNAEGEKSKKVNLPSSSAEAKAKETAPQEAPAAQKKQAAADSADEPTSGEPATRPKATGRRFSGSFEAQRTTTVMPNVSGTIDRVHVEEGDDVGAGDRLIDIDTEDYRLGVEQARASVEAAEANVQTLETEFERTKQLLKKDAVTQSNYDQLKGQLDGARASLKQAKVGLKQARKALRDARVDAPYAATVTEVTVAEGDFAAAGQVPLVTLVETDKLYLRAQIPEDYAGDVQVGDPLRASVPAIEETLELTVDRIDPTINDRSRAFDVLASYEDPDGAVRPGMFAEVSLADQELAKKGGNQ
jgi:RND family efflux transporter MFP subunit